MNQVKDGISVRIYTAYSPGARIRMRMGPNDWNTEKGERGDDLEYAGAFRHTACCSGSSHCSALCNYIWRVQPSHSPPPPSSSPLSSSALEPRGCSSSTLFFSATFRRLLPPSRFLALSRRLYTTIL